VNHMTEQKSHDGDAANDERESKSREEKEEKRSRQEYEENASGVEEEEKRSRQEYEENASGVEEEEKRSRQEYEENASGVEEEEKDAENVLAAMEDILVGLNALSTVQKSWEGGMKELFKFLQKNNREISNTMERYRILAQLGELDAKVLAFSLNNFSINPTIQEKIVALRRKLLLEKDSPLEEVQKEFITIFNLFADDVENMMESDQYPQVAKDIILNMREVSWM